MDECQSHSTNLSRISWTFKTKNVLLRGHKISTPPSRHLTTPSILHLTTSYFFPLNYISSHVSFHTSNHTSYLISSPHTTSTTPPLPPPHLHYHHHLLTIQYNDNTHHVIDHKKTSKSMGCRHKNHQYVSMLCIPCQIICFAGQSIYSMGYAGPKYP